MEITMQFDNLCKIISEYCQTGYMEAVRAYEPARDNIRCGEIDAWLRIMKIDRAKFNALEKCGAIKAFRIGTAKNSPKYYSKAEVKMAINNAGIASMIAKQILAG